MIKQQSRIYSTTSGWLELTTFYQPTNLSSLSDVQFSTIPTNGNMIMYSNNKWRNVSSLDTSLFILSLSVNKQVKFSLNNLADNAHITCYLPNQDTKLIGNSIDAITSIITLNPGSNNQFLMSQGANLPPIFTNINQFPDSINTSSKVNGSLLRYSSTTERWETPDNIN